jgi:periplasmic copper chaperone A
MRKVLIAALTAMPLAGFAQQPAPQQSGIHIDHVWSRAAMAGHEGVVYLTITDTGAADTLTGAATPVAAMAGLHETINDNCVMKMRPVSSLPVAPGKTVTLAPGGTHIMLMDLKRPLREGDSFPITLSFTKAGQVTATATVEKAGAAMPGMDQGSMGGMGNMPMQGSGKQP